MKKISLLWVALAVFALGSCKKVDDNTDQNEVDKNEQAIQKYIKDNSLAAVRDTSGLYYVKTVTNPGGNKAKIGDEVAINYTIYRLSDGFVLDKTDSLLRIPFGTGRLLLVGHERSVSLLRSGEQGTFLLPFYLMFGNQAYDNLPPYSATRIEMELVQVRTQAQQISDYIAKNKLTVSETTPGGIQIARQNSVSGDTLGVGKLVTVNYVGKTINGKQFDKGKLEFTTGGFIAGTNSRTIAGFDEGVRHMRKGEKAILIIPYTKGYGIQGAGNAILPYAQLVFEIEVL